MKIFNPFVNPITNMFGDVISKQTNNMINYVKNAIKSRCFVSIDISSYYSKICNDEKLMKMLYPNAPKILYGHNNKTVMAVGYSEEWENVILYKGVPIYMKRTCCRGISQSDDGEIQRKSVNGFILYTLNKESCKNALLEFVKRCIKYTDKNIKPVISSVDSLFANMIDVIQPSTRTLSDVFISDDIRCELRNSISKFINNKDWFVKHNIPYHYGILLHSAPGSGKTSIARAIANEYGLDMYVCVGGRVSSLIDEVRRNIDILSFNKSKPSIVLFEDIDCDESVHSRAGGVISADVALMKSKTSIGDMLNTLDGILGLSNVIYIFTTNHVDKLDPAILRPGRIDLKLHIDYATPETFDQFLKSFYNRGIPDMNMKIKKDISFATLQIKVMEGYSYDDIIRFMTPEKEKEVIENDVTGSKKSANTRKPRTSKRSDMSV